MAKHIIPEKLIIQSKSHTNLDFLAQLAHLQKFVVMIEGVSGVRMRIRCAIFVAIVVSEVVNVSDMTVYLAERVCAIGAIVQ